MRPFALVLLLSTSPALADADLCARAARQAAAETGVPPAILIAIAGAETGRAGAGGAPQPWPWTLHAGGRGYWLPDAAAARAELHRLIAQGQRNIDIGCFQINLHWHAAAFAAPEAMLDPLANARHAAAFLRDLHARTGDWRQAAGAYHSRDPARAEAYVTRVEAVHERLGAPAPETPPPREGPLIDLDRRLGALVRP